MISCMHDPTLWGVRRRFPPSHLPDGAGPEGGDGGNVRDGVEEAQGRERLHLGLCDGRDLAHAHRPQQQRVQGAQAWF